MNNPYNERLHSPESPGEHLHVVTSRIATLKHDLLQQELGLDDATMMHFAEQIALKNERDARKDAPYTGPDAIDITDMPRPFIPHDDLRGKIVLKMNEMTIPDAEVERYLEAYAKVDEIVHDSFEGISGPFDLRWDDSVTENRIVLSSGDHWGESLYLVLQGNGPGIKQHVELADGREIDPSTILSAQAYDEYQQAIVGIAERVIHQLETKVIPTLQDETDVAA